MKINQNYQNLEDSYLFSTISKKVDDFRKKHPDTEVISLGIGDVTKPLCPAVIDALHEAVGEMGEEATFRGYGPSQGYLFLREAIRDYYKARKVYLDVEEIFVSDGAKSDCANVLDIFSKDNKVWIPDPVYPVYLDTNVMDGRQIMFMDAKEDNQFLPLPDMQQAADLIYLCSPNNPTGAVYHKEQLAMWVNYALKNHALILFDAAYEAFIEEDGLPHSIYEIEGAEKCAVEFCSLSKTAGFTGTRCGYMIVPKALIFENQSLNSLWARRQSTKFNGVSYIVQKGAAAVFSEEGLRQIHKNIDDYKKNAKLIAELLERLGIWYCGGKNSPYIWLKCTHGFTSWEFFDYLLEKAAVVGTPGAGFGKNGEGYFRISSFGKYEQILQAIQRLEKYL